MASTTDDAIAVLLTLRGRRVRIRVGRDGWVTGAEDYDTEVEGDLSYVRPDNHSGHGMHPTLCLQRCGYRRPTDPPDIFEKGALSFMEYPVMPTDAQYVQLAPHPRKSDRKPTVVKPDEKQAAIYWDIENFFDFRLAWSTHLAGKVLSIVWALKQLIESRALSLSPAHAVVCAAKMGDELQRLLQSQGFTVHLIGQRGKNAADKMLKRLLNRSLQSTDSPLLPQVVFILSADKGFRDVVKQLKARDHKVFVVSPAQSNQLEQLASEFLGPRNKE